ncbi:sugar phosphate nucleotidyltransferase, partial [Wenyingzhuangia sp. 1_MG-2023]|nr:sugar phosphate nucleotidyltransferase [Wenyingzhuangia sp. 1_MG-2023]
MKVTRFSEKPANPECIPGKPESALASMGIYVFSSDFLYRTLIDDNDNPDSSRDFGKDIIPGVISRHNVQAFPFT